MSELTSVRICQICILIGLFVMCVVLIGNLQPEEKSTLELVLIVFRHGARTIDKSTIYPKDPYKNETYHPYGLDALTDKGKEQMYNLGKVLHQTYGTFVGEQYADDTVSVITSPYHRTKVSVQQVLTGLFSDNYQRFNNWPKNMEKLFLSIQRCPNFKKFYADAVSSPKMQKRLQQHSKLFAYISENTGSKIETYWDAIFPYMCLVSEDEWGLTLPEWTRPVYPQTLEYFSIEGYRLLTFTTDLKRLSVGYLLGNIVQLSTDKANQKLVPANRKLFLYSGHDVNIAFLLNTLDVFEGEVPPYGAFLSFELHEIDGIYGFKIYYENYSGRQPKLLKLEFCEEFCPLEQFIAFVEEYLPRNDTCGEE